MTRLPVGTPGTLWLERIVAPALLLLVLPAAGRALQQSPADTAAPASRDTTCPAAPDTTGGVAGTVRDRRTTRPLPGVRVRVVVDGGAAGEVRRETRTRELGRFRFCDLPAGAGGTVRAEGGDGSPVEVVGGQTRRVELTADAGRPGGLVGQVRQREGGAPIEGADVRLPGLGLSALTNGEGRFRFEDVPAGTHRLLVRHLSFGPHADSATVRSGRSVHLDVRLATEPVDLPPLAVEVSEVRSRFLENQGFYDRRQTSAGEYFTRDDILERNPARLSYMFRTMSGLRVRGGHLEMVRSPIRGAGGARCRLQYVINGQAAALPMGIDAFHPQDVLAVELYRGPGEVPAVFDEGRASCGVVAIWLRVER